MGSAVLKTLLSHEDGSTKIHIFVRSARRLKLLFPGIESYSYVEITEGQLSDHALMMHCLTGATHIMCTIGSNDNQPGLRMHRDAVEAILAALSELHGKAAAGDTWRRPHMTFLSSASMNEKFISLRPAWLHWLIMNSFNHVYFDLALAEKQLVSSSLISVTLVHAPFIFEGGYSGYTIVTEKPPVSASYADLGAAMADMAFSPAQAEVQVVSVGSHRSMGRIAMTAEQMRRTVNGLLGRFVPGYWNLPGWS
ncbi:nad-dependent epimerase [Colletotrichum kahawae]|uniref:Nad-dependent epimerase n=1 Tax=Colletotrichum kahawae TaxID=34407 RepID=A0AAD9YKR8_COLKA|nr:nad-dependent epimerase [Colletotrichum kahawae]